MKRVTIFTGIVMLAFSLVRGQYFLNHFGTTETESVFSGEITDQLGTGHLMGGFTTDASAALYGPTLVRTDFSGAVGAAGTFENYYLLYNNSGLGTEMISTQCFGLELPTSSGYDYAMAGAQYTDNTYTRMVVWYTRVDAGGNPVVAGDPLFTTVGALNYNSRFYRPNGYDSYFDVRAFELAASGTEAFIMGKHLDNVSGKEFVFVIKVTLNTGNIVWSGSYHVPNQNGTINEPRGMVENTVNGEIAIVGSIDNGSDNDAYLLRLNANGSIVANGVEIFGNSGTRDEFNAIIESASTGYYVITGQSDMVAGDMDFWLVEYDAGAPAMLNSFVYDNVNITSNNQDFGVDLIERNSSVFGWEYFVMGNTSVGPIGGTDIFVQRFDAAFNQVAGVAFATTEKETGVEMDQDNTGTADGYSIYGTTDDPAIDFGGNANPDQIIIKAYYNGVYPCTSSSVTVSQNAGPPDIGSQDPSKVQDFGASRNYLYLPGAISDGSICFANSIAGGDNSKMALPSVGLSVNQMGATVAVNLNSVTSETVVLDFMDVSGKILSTMAVNKPQGEWNGNFTLEGKSIASGIYLVRATTATAVEVQRVFVRN